MDASFDVRHTPIPIGDRISLGHLMTFINSYAFGNQQYLHGLIFAPSVWEALRGRVEDLCADATDPRPHFIVLGVKIIRGEERR